MQVLGVSPFETFDSIKAVYTRRHREAEQKGDEATMARVGAFPALMLKRAFLLVNNGFLYVRSEEENSKRLIPDSCLLRLNVDDAGQVWVTVSP
jgi:hypothetical protein